MSGPRVVGQTVVRKGLAFSGRVGQCASTHSFHALARSREVWAAWRAPFFLIQKKPAVVPNSEAVNSLIGDGFQIPELKGESEASDGYQAGNVNNEALNVIGLHGSGGKIFFCLQEWEMAKAALSCRVALGILCQAMYEVERRRGWFGYWRLVLQ